MPGGAEHGDDEDNASPLAPEEERCNRRLSRAARSLLENTLRQVVLRGDPLIHDSDDIWTLLEHWLRDARPSECPLFPSRDLLRYDEEQSIPIKPPSNPKGAYPSLTIKERRKKQNAKKTKYWWKCGICSKVFASRYYMDLHLKTHHNPDQIIGGDGSDFASGSSLDPMLVCPADDWCRMLGEANCHEQALRNEPFYGRGSDGWEADGQFIQHRYLKESHSIRCNIDTIRSNCRSILEDCRVSDTSLCDVLECPAHHHFWQDASSLMPQDWHSIWMYETKNGTGTIVGILLCVLLSAWVYYMTMMSPYASRKSTGNQLNPGKRGLTKMSQTGITNRSTYGRRPVASRVRKFE